MCVRSVQIAKVQPRMLPSPRGSSGPTLRRVYIRLSLSSSHSLPRVSHPARWCERPVAPPNDRESPAQPRRQRPATTVPTFSRGCSACECAAVPRAAARETGVAWSAREVRSVSNQTHVTAAVVGTIRSPRAGTAWINTARFTRGNALRSFRPSRRQRGLRSRASATRSAVPS